MITRIQRSRAAGSRLADNTLCVSRPSIWGNPWIGPDAVEAYREFCEQVVSGVLCVSTIEASLNVQRKFDKPINEWKALRGEIFEFVSHPPQHVACWCPLNQPCHGNVIAALPHLFAWYRAANGVPK